MRTAGRHALPAICFHGSRTLSAAAELQRAQPLCSARCNICTLEAATNFALRIIAIAWQHAVPPLHLEKRAVHSVVLLLR
jgi:hypothetical protein